MCSMRTVLQKPDVTDGSVEASRIVVMWSSLVFSGEGFLGRGSVVWKSGMVRRAFWMLC